MILDETYNFIKTRFKDQIMNLRIEEVRLGVHLSAVKLSDNSYGVASTMLDNRDPCVKSDRDFGNFTPTKIAGQNINVIVIVTGPSSSLVPDILFRNKVSIIGATSIIKPEMLFPIVSESGAGFHLFKYCAQKICIKNE